MFTSEDAWIGLHQRQPSLTTDCRCHFCPNTEDPPPPECETCASCRGADKWQWEDGTQYDWTNWHHTQPSDFNNEKCVRYRGDGKWYDDHCSRKYYFICTKGITKKILPHKISKSNTHYKYMHDFCNECMVGLILSVFFPKNNFIFFTDKDRTF